MLEIKKRHGIINIKNGKMCVFSRERKKENTHTLKNTMRHPPLLDGTRRVFIGN